MEGAQTWVVKPVRCMCVRGWIFGQNASTASRQGARSASEMQSCWLDKNVGATFEFSFIMLSQRCFVLTLAHKCSRHSDKLQIYLSSPFTRSSNFIIQNFKLNCNFLGKYCPLGNVGNSLNSLPRVKNFKISLSK